jgi:hypothetical protein
MFFQPLIIFITVIICFFSFLYNYYNKTILDKNKYYYSNTNNFINYKKYLMNYSELLNIDITKELDDIDIKYINKLLEIKFKLDKKNFNNKSSKESDNESGKESDNESDKESEKESDNESGKESDNESGKESDNESDKESEK